MAKYIFLFCILLSVFLVSGFESVSNDMKEYKELRVTELQQSRPECNLSNVNTEQCKKIVYGGEYASKAIGNIATSVSRSNIPSSQVLRFNAFSVVAKIVKSIKVLLPEEKRFYFPYHLSLTQYSSRYYIYALNLLSLIRHSVLYILFNYINSYIFLS